MKRRMVAAAMLSAALLSSCASTPKPRTDIGMTKVGLSQAFKDETLEALPPNVIVQLVPALSLPVAAKPMVPGTPIPIPNPCPTAPDDATVPGAAPLTIVGQPKAGFYKRHNVGTIKISTGPISAQFPYPFVSYDEIKDVKTVETSPLPQVTKMPKTQFTVVQNISRTYVIEDTYQYDASTMDLVHHEEVNNGAVIQDDWMPPVEVFDQTGIGKNWQDIGASTTSRRLYTITGNMKGKRVVDVCGSLFETLEAKSSTTIADLANRQTSGTTSGKKDGMALATASGGLPARREVHSTQVLTANNLPVTIETDVVSTIDSLTPLAEKPAL